MASGLSAFFTRQFSPIPPDVVAVILPAEPPEMT
jgi:hypothetical protein